MLKFIFYNTCHYFENAEMTPVLHDGLISLSFEKVHDFFRTAHPNILRNFIVHFLNCLKTLVSVPLFYFHLCVLHIFTFHDTAII